jgi:hypothetical protein
MTRMNKYARAIEKNKRKMKEVNFDLKRWKLAEDYAQKPFYTEFERIAQEEGLKLKFRKGFYDYSSREVLAFCHCVYNRVRLKLRDTEKPSYTHLGSMLTQTGTHLGSMLTQTGTHLSREAVVNAKPTERDVAYVYFDEFWIDPRPQFAQLEGKLSHLFQISSVLRESEVTLQDKTAALRKRNEEIRKQVTVPVGELVQLVNNVSDKLRIYGGQSGAFTELQVKGILGDMFHGLIIPYSSLFDRKREFACAEILETIRSTNVIVPEMSPEEMVAFSKSLRIWGEGK